VRVYIFKPEVARYNVAYIRRHREKIENMDAHSSGRSDVAEVFRRTHYSCLVPRYARKRALRKIKKSAHTMMKLPGVMYSSV